VQKHKGVRVKITCIEFCRKYNEASGYKLYMKNNKDRLMQTTKLSDFLKQQGDTPQGKSVYQAFIDNFDKDYDAESFRKDEKGSIDYSQDFFGKQASLTVSGQLEGELAALSLGEIYTFGPTFRAENSNTPRHLSEFWMIEPEMAFYEIEDNMELAEDFVKYCIRWALKNCKDDIDFLIHMLLYLFWYDL
jgi:hypothetical protein